MLIVRAPGQGSRARKHEREAQGGDGMQKWNRFLSSNRDKAGSSTSGGKARLRSRWGRLWHEEEGQTLVEYGLLLGLLALVVVIAVTLFGRRMSNNLYGTSNNVLPFNN